MGQAAEKNDEDLLTQLPPLEHGEDDEDEGPRDNYGAELSELSAFEGDDLEEQDAMDLDVGVNLPDLDQESQLENTAELGLDVGDLLARIEDGDASDDRAGLPDLDMSEGVQDVEFDTMGAGNDEGFGESMEDLVDEALPGLDADADGDFEAGNFGNLEIVDDDRPATVTALYAVEEIDSGEHVQVASIGMGIAALGADLVFHRSGTAPRHVALPARATTLVALDDAVLVGTVAGSLLRARPDGHLDVFLAFERDVPRTLSSAPYALRAGANSEQISVLLDTGELTVSHDSGQSFKKVHFARALRALSAAGSVASDAEELLFVSGGHVIALPDPVRDTGAADLMLLADSPGRVIVALPEIGVLHSSDSGETFTRIVGTQGASAVMIDGGILWVGLAGTAFQDAALLQVDLADASATTVCTLRGTPGETIYGIAKSEQDGKLWIASSAGLFAVAPTQG